MVSVTLSLELLLMMGVGIFAQKKQIVKSDFDSQLTSFLLNLSVPCMIFQSMVSEEFSYETLRNCGIMLLLSLAICGIQTMLGQIFYILCGRGGQGRIVRYCTMFVHFSFMGIPIIDTLYGSTGTLYYAVFLIPVRILYYGASQSLLTPPDNRKVHQPISRLIKKLFSPCLTAVLAGMIFWINQWELPEIINYCIENLAKICSPLGLILCGLAVGKYKFGTMMHLRFLKLPLLRTVALPALFFALRCLLRPLQISPLILDICMIYTALPIPSLTAAFVILYEPDPKIQFEVSGSILVATLLSAVTIPVWTWLLQTI